MGKPTYFQKEFKNLMELSYLFTRQFQGNTQNMMLMQIASVHKTEKGNACSSYSSFSSPANFQNSVKADL